MNEFDVVRVGVGLAICKGSKVLLQKRKGKHANGTWCFPGGHMEKWEDFEEAACRETIEEAGTELRFTQPTFWTTVNTKYIEEGKHYVVVLMRCNWLSGEAINMEPDKNEGWEWFDWNSLPQPLIQGLQIIKKQGLYPYHMLDLLFFENRKK